MHLLADRMGMNRIRDELEDLSFKVLNNEARELIKSRLDDIKDNRTNTFNAISYELSDILNQNHLSSKIFGREKTPFSIWRKIQKKRISLEQITDIMGFRIILDNVDDCYKALGFFTPTIIVSQENSKIIYLHQKLIIINLFILL